MVGKCTHKAKEEEGAMEDKGVSLWKAPLSKKGVEKVGMQQSTNSRDECVLYKSSVNGAGCAQ